MVSESNSDKQANQIIWQGHKVVVAVNFPTETA
jgi:hypothetical protein